MPAKQIFIECLLCAQVEIQEQFRNNRQRKDIRTQRFYIIGRTDKEVNRQPHCTLEGNETLGERRIMRGITEKS